MECKLNSSKYSHFRPQIHQLIILDPNEQYIVSQNVILDEIKEIFYLCYLSLLGIMDENINIQHKLFYISTKFKSTNLINYIVTK
jgi:hypothetical protein